MHAKQYHITYRVYRKNINNSTSNCCSFLSEAYFSKIHTKCDKCLFTVNSKKCF